jgi:transglutaminase-like putative cysteine protease
MYQSLKRRWEDTKTDYSEELGLDIAMLAVPMAAMIVAAAAFSPNISPRSIRHMVQEALRQPQSQIRELGDSLGLLPAPAVASKFEDMRSPGMPRQHLLGSGPELSKELVMEVRTLEVGDLHPTAKTAPLNYWRWLTYDIYTGSGWTTGRLEAVSYRAGELARPPGWGSNAYPRSTLPNQIFLKQEIQILAPRKEALYAVGTVLSMDANYQLAWRSYSEAGADTFGGFVDSSHYQVRSLVSALVESQQHTSGLPYPEELLHRYLELPDSLPQRVHSLALELTATLPTPYERARAIEDYLRRIPYSLEVHLPARGTDVIDYYLFDLKRGYCDYAASAMVVLARAAGIPARLVTGYAGGSYDPNRALVVVSEADAHSWAELYIPGSGWIEFEPTGGRPRMEDVPEGEPPVQVNLEEPVGPTSVWPAWPILLAFPAALTLFLAIRHGYDRWRLGKMAPDRAVMVLYDRFYQNSSQLAAGSSLAQTPNEFAAMFTGWMDRLAVNHRWSKRLAITPPQVNKLTELYNLAVYSSHQPGLAERQHAIRTWNQIFWRLWLLRLFPGLFYMRGGVK